MGCCFSLSRDNRMLSDFPFPFLRVRGSEVASGGAGHELRREGGSLRRSVSYGRLDGNEISRRSLADARRERRGGDRNQQTGDQAATQRIHGPICAAYYYYKHIMEVLDRLTVVIGHP